MSKMAIMDVLLSKVAADQKEAFIAEIREAGTKKERLAVIKKYCGELTEAEKEKLKKHAAAKSPTRNWTTRPAAATACAPTAMAVTADAVKRKQNEEKSQRLTRTAGIRESQGWIPWLL